MTAPAERCPGLFGKMDDWGTGLQYMVAALVYLILAVLLIPNSTSIVATNWIEFEGADAYFRIAWFHDVIYGEEESIWFLRRAFFPEGMPLVYQSAGILKELIAALLGGGLRPYVANNIIVLSTPITVGLAGFTSAKYLIKGGFLVSLTTGWLMAWTAAHALLNLTGWLVSTEGVILFLFCLMLLRDSPSLRVSVFLGIGAGLSAGLAVWTFLQHIPFIVMLSIVFVVDRLIARRPRDIVWLVLAGMIALLLCSPLLWQVWSAFRGKGELLSGGARIVAYSESSALATMFVPPREFKFLGFIPQWFEEVSGRSLHTNAIGYIQYVVAVLAVIGVCSKRRGTGFLAAVWCSALVLAIGPKLTLLTSGMETTGIPWIYVLLWEVPVFNTMRVPLRWNILGQVASGLLAGYGIMHLISMRPSLQPPKISALFCAGVIALHCFEVTFIVLHDSSHYHPEPPFLVIVRDEPGDFAILDIPYEMGSHRPLKFGSIHRKGVVWGIGGRMPFEEQLVVERDFKFPGIVDMEPIRTADEINRFAESLIRYNVRYIYICRDIFLQAPELLEVVVDQLEDEDLWAAQQHVLPPRLVWDDEHSRAYQIEVRTIPNSGE